MTSDHGMIDHDTKLCSLSMEKEENYCNQSLHKILLCPDKFPEMMCPDKSRVYYSFSPPNCSDSHIFLLLDSYIFRLPLVSTITNHQSTTEFLASFEDHTTHYRHIH